MPEASKLLSPPAGAMSLEQVKRRVRAIERGGALDEGGPRRGHEAFRLGAPALDGALPWGGLARGALHEIADRSVDGAALGFASALLVRLLRAGAARDAAKTSSTVLWCFCTHRAHETGALYGPGLAAFGLDPSHLILVRVKRAADVLRVMREGLACRRITAVVGEGTAADLKDSRRLQLAAEAIGATALLLRPATLSAAPSAALTRWSVAAAPSGAVLPGQPIDDALARALGPGPARWRLRLERCRGGAPSEWVVEWCPEAGIFAPCHAVPAPAASFRMPATAGSRASAFSTGRTLNSSRSRPA